MDLQKKLIHIGAALFVLLKESFLFCTGYMSKTISDCLQFVLECFDRSWLRLEQRLLFILQRLCVRCFRVGCAGNLHIFWFRLRLG